MSEISQKQLRAIEALVHGYRVDIAASEAGVTKRTVNRWKKEPAFATELKRRSMEALHDASQRLRGALNSAIDTLQEIMDNPEAAPSVRVRAAVAVLDSAVKFTEVSDVVERLDALEAAINAQ